MLTNHLILKEKRVLNTNITQKIGHKIRPSQNIRDSEFETVFLLVSYKKSFMASLRNNCH